MLSPVDIETTVKLFQMRGFSLTPECLRRLKEEIVDHVNDRAAQKREKGERTNAIEGKGKTYMAWLVKNMIEEGKSRRSSALGEDVFEVARRVVGQLVLPD